MTSTENKRKELEHILIKENFVKITEAIKVLREEPPVRGVISLLVGFYDRTDNDSVRRLISEFLNDLKDQAACSEVMDELKKDIKSDTKRMVIASCWQSGLDYSGSATDFARMFCSSDYMTAIECFTVIESSADRLSQAERDELIGLIHEGTMSGSDEIKILARELVSGLKQ
jgi:hypothetical protein